ncbi:MAG: lysophospholipid acyltransferase family protein [Bacteroidota bacterium]
MKRIVDYFLSTIYFIFFGFFLLIFHPIQLAAFHIWGPKAHQITVHWLNFFLLKFLIITGANIKFSQKGKIPSDRPIILVSNHQSMFDIIGIIWFLRKYNPIFVSKIELSKGIPSISLNLRLSGAALINRKDSRQAIPEIARMAKTALERGFSPSIFPEGTRSKTDQIKPFAIGGLAVLLKYTKNAVIVPIAIKGNNKLNPKGFFPFVSFTNVNFTALPVVEPSLYSNEELIILLESQIRDENSTTK